MKKAGPIRDRLHISVEATGVEPVSKHIRRKLSTCLFYFVMSGSNWKQTTDYFLSCMVLSNQHSL